MKKLLCIVLSVIFVISAFSVVAGAEEITYEEWSQYYETCDNTALTMTPGKNETELNFCWHSVKNGNENPVVRLSKNADMSDYKEFTGKGSNSEIADQKVNDVTVTGLEENTTYYYTYIADGKESEIETFKTHSFDSYKFLYISDAQPKHDHDMMQSSFNWNRTLEAAFNANDDISFIVNAGDVTHCGQYTSEWTAFLAPEYLRSYPMAATQGNHDAKGMSYKYYFNNPNVFLGLAPTFYGNGYYFTYGDVLFVFVNSNKINFLDNYWLIKRAVKENPDAKWRMAVMHHDIYGTEHHAIQDDAVAMQRALAPVFDSYDFDAVLTGHDHVYGRSYFMKGHEVVENAGYDEGKVTNPEGVIYFTQTASSGNTRIPDEDYNYYWLGKTVITGNDCYTTIEVTKDGTMEFITVDKVTEETIDTFSITKTEPFKEEPMTEGYLGAILKPLMGEYYVIYEMFYNIIHLKLDRLFK